MFIFSLSVLVVFLLGFQYDPEQSVLFSKNKMVRGKTLRRMVIEKLLAVKDGPVVSTANELLPAGTKPGLINLHLNAHLYLPRL